MLDGKHLNQRRGGEDQPADESDTLGPMGKLADIFRDHRAGLVGQQVSQQEFFQRDAQPAAEGQVGDDNRTDREHRHQAKQGSEGQGGRRLRATLAMKTAHDSGGKTEGGENPAHIIGPIVSKGLPVTSDRRGTSTDIPARGRFANLAASVSLIALIALCLAWELRLAPLKPGGSWLVLKTLPLLAPLFGILHGRRYTHQWASLLSLAYLAEGVVRVTTDSGSMRTLAGIEVLLAVVLFASTVAYARITRPSATIKAAD